MTSEQYSRYYTNHLNGTTKVSILNKIKTSYAQATTFGLAASVEYIVNTIKREWALCGYALVAVFGFICGFTLAILLVIGVL